MNRREALKNSAWLTGCGLSAGTVAAIISGCSAPDPYAESFLGSDYMNVMAEVVETIIPTTDTPGALDAGVHLFIDQAAKHFETEELAMVKTFLDGLIEADFTKGSTEEKEAQLLAFDQPDEAGINHYELLRQLTCHGYFTSEVGAKEALAYLPIPGEYVACMPLSEVGKSWSE